MSENPNNPWIENDGQRLILDPKFGHARPIAEYREDMGIVLWWKFPIIEPPYVGTPDSVGKVVSIEVWCGGKGDEFESYVGGWPGDHTHFTQIVIPEAP